MNFSDIFSNIFPPGGSVARIAYILRRDVLPQLAMDEAVRQRFHM